MAEMGIEEGRVRLGEESLSETWPTLVVIRDKVID